MTTYAINAMRFPFAVLEEKVTRLAMAVARWHFHGAVVSAAKSRRGDFWLIDCAPLMKKENTARKERGFDRGHNIHQERCEKNV